MCLTLSKVFGNFRKFAINVLLKLPEVIHSARDDQPSNRKARGIVEKFRFIVQGTAATSSWSINVRVGKAILDPCGQLF